MAWKVVGALDNDDMRHGATCGFYGPHPAKVWVKQAGEKRPRMPKAQNKLAGKSENKNDYNDRRAVQYAIWLAQRDGIQLSGFGRPIHEFVSVNGKHEKFRSERRVMMVQFNNRAITIPNWDFVPREPVEEILPADEIISDMRQAWLDLILSACLSDDMPIAA